MITNYFTDDDKEEPNVKLNKKRSYRTSTVELFEDWDDWNSDQDVVPNKKSNGSSMLIQKRAKPQSNPLIPFEGTSSHETSTAISEALQPKNLEEMIRTAVYHEVEKKVQEFFAKQQDFIPQLITSHSSFVQSPFVQQQKNPTETQRRYRVNFILI